MFILAQALDEISSTAKHTVGQRYINETNGKEYIYCQDDGSAIEQYQAVHITPAFSAAALTKANADKNYLVGAAQVAVTASYYFWCLVRGTGTVRVASACASECLLYTTATAGRLDDSATDQTGVANIHLTTTAGTAAASANVACVLNNPKAFAAETVLDVAGSKADSVGLVALSAASSAATASSAGSVTRLAASSAMSSASVGASNALLAYSAGSSAMSSASIGASNALLAYSAGSSAMSSAMVATSNASTADSKALLAYSAGSSAMSSASIAGSNALLAYSAGSSAASSCSVAQSGVDRMDLACSAYADSAVANSHSNAVSAAISACPNYIGLMLSAMASGISSGIGKNF